VFWLVLPHLLFGVIATTTSETSIDSEIQLMNLHEISAGDLLVLIAVWSFLPVAYFIPRAEFLKQVIFESSAQHRVSVLLLIGLQESGKPDMFRVLFSVQKDAVGYSFSLSQFDVPRMTASGLSCANLFTPPIYLWWVICW